MELLTLEHKQEQGDNLVFSGTLNTPNTNKAINNSFYWNISLWYGDTIAPGLFPVDVCNKTYYIIYQ